MSDLTFHEKIVLIQKEMVVKKDSTNAFGKYKYRTLDGILSTARPLLKTYGLTLITASVPVLIGDRFYIKTTSSISDGEKTLSTHAFARESFSKKGMDDAQVTGTAQTYSTKYCMANLFAISGEDDADSQDNETNPSMTEQQVLADEAFNFAVDVSKKFKGTDEQATWFLNRFGYKAPEIKKQSAKDLRELIENLKDV